MSLKIFRGVVSRGVGWATIHKNWDRLVNAHCDELPDIGQYVPGSLNIILTDPPAWQPPRDDELRGIARRKGVKLKLEYSLGGDFLYFGNYVHPDLRVIRINGIAVDGVLYYAGSQTAFGSDGLPQPIARDRIEILSKARLRKLLGMEDDSIGYEVVVETLLQ